MGERKFTLVELHLDGDNQFGPRVLPGIFTGSDDETAETEGVGTSPTVTSSDEGEEADGRGVFPLVAGVIAMVAIAVAVRRFRRDEEPEEFEERDVVVN